MGRHSAGKREVYRLTKRFGREWMSQQRCTTCTYALHSQEKESRDERAGIKKTVP